MNRAAMNAPLADEELLTFVGRGKQTMTYIEDETVMDRLDLGYGHGNWQIQVDAVPYAEHVVKVRLGVRESGEWVWYEDFGYPNNTDGETLKQAVSDGIRRCGRYVGIARDLYRKSTYERKAAASDRQAEEAEQAERKAETGDKSTETLRSIGPVSRSGAVAKGSGRHSDLEWRQTPDGYQIGFLLEVGDGKDRPQVSVGGPLAVSLFAATTAGGEDLLGKRIAVEGEVFEVRAPNRKMLYRIVASRLTTDEWIIPPLETREPTDEEQADLDRALELVP